MNRSPDTPEPVNADNFRNQLIKETQLVKDCCVKSSENISELLQTMLGIKGEIGKFLEEIKQLNQKTDEESKTDQNNKGRSRDYRLQNLLLKSSRRTANLLNNINQAIGSAGIQGGGERGGACPTPQQTADWVARTLGQRGGAGGDDGGDHGGHEGGGGGRGGEEGRGRSFASRTATRVANLASEALGGWSIRDLFSGVIRDVTDYTPDMRTLAYQVDGLTEDTRGLQADFANLGGQVEATTGQLKDATQKAYQAIMKKGVSSMKGGQKDALRVVKTGIHAATMLGASVEQTSELFGDWYRTLGMSAGQMDQLARDSKDIARYTGVTGDELVGVMKKSEGILRNLKNQSNLTSAAAKNVIRAMAEAEKLGISDLASTVFSALSSTHKFFNETDEATKRFLATMGSRMGKLAEMQSGTFFNNRKNFGLMADEMEKVFSEMTGGLSIEDIDKLGDEEKAQLEYLMQQVFGKSIDEYKRMLEMARNSSQNAGQSFEKLAKEINETTEGTEKRKKLEKQMNDLIRGVGLNALSTYTEQMEKLGDKTKAANAIFEDQKFSEMAEDINDMLIQDMMKKDKSLTKEQATEKVLKMNYEDRLAEMSRIGLEKLQEQAKKRGVTTVESGTYTKDSAEVIAGKKKEGDAREWNVDQLDEMLAKAIRENNTEEAARIGEAMTALQQQVDVKEIKGVDPINETNQHLIELNGYLRKTIAPFIQKLVDSMGSLGLIMALLIGPLVGLVGYLPGLITSFGLLSILGKLLKDGDGGGGGGGAGFFGGIAGTLLKGAFALLAIAAAIYVFAQAMKVLETIDWDKTAPGLIVLGLAIGILGVAAWAIGSFAPVIALGAGVIALLGLALIPFGWGLQAVAPAVKIFVDVLNSFILTLGKFVEIIIGSVINAFNTLINGISKLATLDVGALFGVAGALLALGFGAVGFAAGMALATAGDLFTGLLRLFGAQSPLDKIQEFIPVASEIASIGKGFKDFGDGIKGIAENIGNLNSKALSDLKDNILEFLDIESMDELELMAEYLGKIAEFLKEINNINSGSKMEVPTPAPPQALVNSEALPPEFESKLTEFQGRLSQGEQAQGQAKRELESSLAASEQNRGVEPSVQPKANVDLVSSMVRDKVSAESGNVSLKSDELSNIETSAEEQNNHLVKVNNNLEKIVDLLGPSNSAGESNQFAASTKDNKVPAGVANFGLIAAPNAGSRMLRSTVPTATG